MSILLGLIRGNKFILRFVLCLVALCPVALCLVALCLVALCLVALCLVALCPVALCHIGYEVSPDLIFKTKRVYSENVDGTSEIKVDIDPLFTKCIDMIYVNPKEEIKLLIQSRIEKQISNIIDDSINRGIYMGKTKREIIMTYEPEEISDELVDEA